MIRTFALILLLMLAACSLPPESPVTRNDLMRTMVYKRYVIQESPEEVINALNRDGEVIMESKRNIPGKNIPVHVKILATSEGLEVLEYER
ncbi:hypothetical protein [Trichloromonas sp.]|uniref:hypothetical protein n=1 Tax=Trichloromonas sp. TaxID=3069249 RepID=UPI003D813FD8